jgi:tetratricopeptide (TPR) repeat protein
MALQSLNNMRVGHLLPFVLLSYLLIAHGAVSATRLLKQRTARIVAGIALIGALLFLQVFVGVDGRSTLRFAVDLEPNGRVKDALMGVYGFDLYAGDWETCHLHAPEVRAVGRWIEENLAPQSKVLCEWHMLDSIYVYTGGDYVFSELDPYPKRRPPIRMTEREGDIRVARILYEPVLDTWADEASVISIWPPSGRTLSTALVYAVVEGHFLSQVRAADAEYVIATTANNLLGDYLEAHPGFEEMVGFDDIRVRIFQVHDPYALGDYPTYVDLGLIATVIERWGTDTATGRELRSFFQDGLGWTEAEMWLALAESSQRQHYVKEAVPLFERAIAAAPADPAAYLALGQLYESRGMVEHALALYERGQANAGSPELAGRAAQVRLAAQPGVPHPQEAMLGSTVRLLGYDLPVSTFRSGDDLEITLYWEALDTMDDSYTMFVHILDEGGTYVSGLDNPPQRGMHPTNGWLSGEIVSDAYAISLPDDTLPGTYTITVGAYDPQTMTRLVWANGTTAASLDTAIQVVTR